MDKVLLVSALYKFKSKTDFSLYIERANDLISNTYCDMVVFTEASIVDVLVKRNNLTIIILEASEWESNKFAKEEEFYEQIPNFRICFWVWDELDIKMIKIYMEKHIFVNRAIDAFPNYKYYIWNDIGVKSKPVRLFKKYLSSYPDISKIDSMNLGDKICFQMRRYPTQEEKNKKIQLSIDGIASIIGGAIIVGNKNAWRTFKILYRRSIDYFKLNNLFWGNDEPVYFNMIMKNPNNATAVYTVNPTLVNGIITSDCNFFGYFGAYALFSGDSNFKLTLFDNPIYKLNGNIKEATWGAGSQYSDVTNIIRNLPPNTNILLDNFIFPDDPASGKFKTLYVQYENGKVDEVNEYEVFSINPS